MKSRIVIVFVGVMIMWTMMLMRSFYLQVLPNKNIEALRKKQFETTINLVSKRGAIYDANGRELAVSAPAYSLYVDPTLIKEKRKVAQKLAPILGGSVGDVLSKLNSKKRFAWIERQLSVEKYDAIKELKIKGLSFVDEPRRIYPNNNLLAQTIGVVGGEGKGLEGLELRYDEALRGNSKKILVRRDARGRPLEADGLLFTENPEGADLHLTIDSEIQYVLERELSTALQEFEAESAVAVVLDAQTSEVVALASAPTFDVNSSKQTSLEYRRNRSVTDLFEPGSTMKTFVVAGALRQRMLQPNTKYFCENGRFEIGKRVIRESDSKYKWEYLTATEILAVSSNIGTTKIAMQLGADNLRRTLLDFGFGSKSGLDLPGEVGGRVLPLPWHTHLLGNISFGHGISATAVQVANAYAAVVNGGVLRKPRIVKQIVDNETGEIKAFEAQEVRRVLTAEESAKMRMMLASVTAPGGTGVNARVSGYPVGGKTGTAQKVDPNGRGYLKGAYISSFAGFIPANDPKFVIFVAVDSPQKAYYGSQVAAPVFSRVASFAVRKVGLPAVILAENEIPNKPKRLPASKLTKRSEGSKTKISSADLNKKNLYKEELTEAPNLLNLTTREVLQRLRGSDVTVHILGQGLVSEMSPAPGESLAEDKKITVILK